MIAQEVEAVFPELVTHWGEEDHRAVDYGRFTAVLIEAIKELKTENGRIKEELEATRNQIAEIKELFAQKAYLAQLESK